jgi:methylated-DNA-[protein]-cysteine S-methyltransferase
MSENSQTFSFRGIMLEVQRMTSTFYTQIESPVGPLLLAADDVGLRQILFVNGRHPAKPESSWKEDSAPHSETIRQLKAYFAGDLENFDLQLAPEGTPFQLGVWRTLCEIPYGETISYGELASRIGNPKASRAVGLANGSNPIPIVIPCHRVIGSNGKLTGYGGGLPIKEKLLALERRQLRLL